MINKIRIIGGAMRSRPITLTPHPNLRPTPNRVRETLFNWLREDIAHAQCLDLFAGSGALGFEALSRGARSIDFIEQDAKIMHELMKNAEKLGVTQAHFHTDNAMTWLEKNSPQPFDIIFLDPPYQENLLLPCLTLLVQRGFLSPHAEIYLEHNAPLAEMTLPDDLKLIQHKKAGQVYYGLCARR